MKTKTIATLLLLCFFIVIVFLGCSTETKIEDEIIKVDSTAIKDSIESHLLADLVERDSVDFILDSIELNYSIDSKQVLNKRVLAYGCYIDDVYEDNSGFHVVLFPSIGFEDAYLNLSCTSEQAQVIMSDKRENKGFYNLTFKPLYIRKINQKLFAYTENEETDDVSAYMTIKTNSTGGIFKIEGSLQSLSKYEPLY